MSVERMCARGGASWVNTAEGKKCLDCGGVVPKKSADAGERCSIITPDLKKFAEWQIGMLEKGIMQNRRLIHEIRQMYGIRE